MIIDTTGVINRLVGESGILYSITYLVVSILPFLSVVALCLADGERRVVRVREAIDVAHDAIVVQFAGNRITVFLQVFYVYIQFPNDINLI